MTPWTLVVGTALVNFVWQGTVIALAAALLLRVLCRRSARVRYVVACAALAVMLVAPFTAAFSVPAPEHVTAAAPAAASALRPAATPVDIGRVRGEGDTPLPQVAWLSAPRILPFVVMAWLAGVVLLLGRLCVGWIRVRRLHADSFAMPLSRWAATGGRIAARLSLARAIRFVDSALVRTPVVVGWLHPAVLLPVAALSQLTPEQVEAIIAHELAHVRRHDFVVNVLQCVAETLLFYHPAVWWLSSRIRIEREHCCDDVAVSLCGNPVEYAEALAHLASWNLAPALAVGATAGPLLDRVRRLLGLEPRRPDHRRVPTLALASLLVVVVLLSGVRTIGAARAASDDDAVWLARLAELHRIVPDFHGHLVPGPMDINRIMHYDLFPTPVTFPTDDPHGARAWDVTVAHPGGQIALNGFTARGLVRYAYGLGEQAVIDVPRWMDERSFTLRASAPAATPETEDVLLALRVALEEQFDLRLRRQVRDYPVYALKLANADRQLGPNIHRSAPGTCVSAEMLRAGSVARYRDFQGRPSCGVRNSMIGPAAYGVSIGDLARAIERPWLDRPVVDRTGLKGTFDARLQLGLVPLSVIASVHPDATTVIESMGVRSMQHALPEQLGLRLEDATAPYDVVVVEGAVPRARR